MKKPYVISIAIILVLLGCLAAYRYVYLPSNSCVQVLVSATNRITGVEKVFGDPCSVPFWYKDVRDFNSELINQDDEKVYTVKEVLGTISANQNDYVSKKISIRAVNAGLTKGVGCADYMILMDEEDAARIQQLNDLLKKAQMDKEETEKIYEELLSLPHIKTGEILTAIPGVFPTESGIYQGHFYDEKLINECEDGEARFVIDRKVKELAQ